MTEEEPTVLTRYRVTWSRSGSEETKTTESVVDSEDLSRPGDADELNLVVRRNIANAYLPLGPRMPDPENVVIHDLIPLCNCEPYPSPESCTYATYKGNRFYLTAADRPGYETIRDHHREKVLGTVCITLSVELLTLVQQKYGHQ